MTGVTAGEPDDLVLAAEFPAATRQQWQRLVAKVLRVDGDVDSPERQLATITADGIEIEPLYVADGSRPVPGYPGQPPFVRGRGPAGNRGGWDVRQRHEHPDPATAREQILDDLEGGVSSLWLGLGDGRIPVDALPDVLAETSTSTWPRSSSTRASGSPRRRRCTSTSPRAAGSRPARWPAASAPTRSACWPAPASTPPA